MSLANKKFFIEQEKLNRDKWLMADGWAQHDNSFNNSDLKRNNEWFGADADMAMAPDMDILPQQPYIIQVSNSCASAAVSNVDIGNAYATRIKYDASGTFNYGQSSNISITSTVTDITYQEFLAATEVNPFTVGKTMIISSNANQVEQTVQINHKNAAGKQDSFVISAAMSPFQNLTDRVIDETAYVWDGFTRFRFNQINAAATVTVRLYLKNKFSPTRIIQGLSGVIGYTNPNLIMAVS